jgi:hypothetical protein
MDLTDLFEKMKSNKAKNHGIFSRALEKVFLTWLFSVKNVGKNDLYSK